MKHRHITAAVSGVLALGILASPASAAERLFAVTLTNGKAYLVPIEADPATPVDQLQFPQMEAPIASIQELPTTTPTPTVTAGPTGPTSTAGPTGTLTPSATPKPTRTPAATSVMQGPDVTDADRQAVADALGKLKSVDGDGAEKPSKKEKKADNALTPLASTGFGGGFVPLHLPNFFIDHFSIPPFLLPIYQAAGVQYGVRWEVLAAINSIETNYGRNLNVSSAGAVGWMQFMPATWKQWGVDANRDGVKDPYNPVDAIFAAARYLKAAGAQDDLRRSIFAYNHAGWYVDDVMLRARTLSGLPPSLIAGLTGLTEGRFPVAGKAKSVREPDGKSALIHARSGAPVFAITDGVVTKRSKTSITLRDAYGNAFVYGGLGAVVKRVSPPPEIETPSSGDVHRAPLNVDPAATDSAAPTKVRLYANHTVHHAASVAPAPATTTGAAPADGKAHPLLPGRRVVAGSVLGSLLASKEGTSQMRFAIRPGGRNAPRIDPTPILDGWKLLDETKIRRATDAKDGDPSIGQVLLMGKGELARLVLADPDISIYSCGRRDIRYGLIDRRVLATLEVLRLSGMNPTVSALECGHSRLTTSGNVSEHWVGQAVDISAINGTPIAGHQGPGSITEAAIDRLVELQGAMTPHQIISLMALPQAGNTLAMEDHADHIHVGFAAASSKIGHADARGLKRGQWARLVARLGEIKNPVIRPSTPPESDTP